MCVMEVPFRCADDSLVQLQSDLQTDNMQCPGEVGLCRVLPYVPTTA